MSTKCIHVGSCWIEYGMMSKYSDRWLRFRRAHSSRSKEGGGSNPHGPSLHG